MRWAYDFLAYWLERISRPWKQEGELRPSLISSLSSVDGFESLEWPTKLETSGQSTKGRECERERTAENCRGAPHEYSRVQIISCVKKWYKDGEKQSESFKWNSIQYSTWALGIMPVPPRHNGKPHNSQNIVQNAQKHRHKTLGSISSRYWVGHRLGSPNRSL